MPSRPPTPAELAILKALLKVDFPGSGDLKAQLKSLQVSQIDSNGSLRLAPMGGPLAQVAHRVPVEAEAVDEDGVGLHVLLHVLEGRAAELEVYKEDSSAVVRMPQPDDLTILVSP